MRGTGKIKDISRAYVRITPACAGNRGLDPPHRVDIRDHPRVCGEQITPSLNIPCLTGSPPRVRGTGVFRPGYLGGHGITPACAGNSYFFTAAYALLRITPACAGNRFSCSFFISIIGDHPRVCGEQAFVSASAPMVEGSPPRVRGTGEIKLETGTYIGITPACAGNSPAGWPYKTSNEDHPRVCGEQTPAAEAAIVVAGSPPRVRGTDNY